MMYCESEVWGSMVNMVKREFGIEGTDWGGDEKRMSTQNCVRM